MRRIKELRSLGQDIAQKSAQGQNVNFKDCRPADSKRSFPLSKNEKALQKGSDGLGTLSAGKGSIETADTTRSLQSTSSVTEGGQAGGIVKTVILPYDEINNLKAECEYLKQYKQQQKDLFEEAIQGYQKDKVIRLQEFQLKEQDT